MARQASRPNAPEPMAEIPSATGPAPVLFKAGRGGVLEVGGRYNPGDADEIDHAIRYLPTVVAHCAEKARELEQDTGSTNFEVVLQNTPKRATRPRAYVAPSNSDGIREERGEAVLTKAALGMAGK